MSDENVDASLAPAGEFPSLDDICYMNTASIGLIPRSALAAEEMFQRQLGQYGTTWFDEPTEVGVLEQARREGAALLGAPAEQVAVTTSVTEALSQIAWSLRPESGSNVVSIDLEFPTVTYPWMRVARDTGAEVRLVSAAGDPAKLSFEGLAEAVDRANRSNQRQPCPVLDRLSLPARGALGVGRDQWRPAGRRCLAVAGGGSD